jgi:hypothetical protein
MANIMIDIPFISLPYDTLGQTLDFITRRATYKRVKIEGNIIKKDFIKKYDEHKYNVYHKLHIYGKDYCFGQIVKGHKEKLWRFNVMDHDSIISTNYRLYKSRKFATKKLILEIILIKNIKGE